MFTEKMARLTSEFTAQILVALRAASLEELSARRPHAARPRGPAPRKASRTSKRPGLAPAAKAPDGAVTRAALDYFAGRGRKGATGDQLGAHLAELGVAASAEGVIAVLSEQGAIRDAGFRRSTGTGHKTSVVWVSGG
ncbi:MAG TPA: hypothetical protein VLT33_28225 [Labilithrix sp.]|nr:hypothetical protein [Labilithrix sp.]